MLLIPSVMLEALGWSLLASLWQMGLLWAVYMLITGLARRGSAAGRHLLAFLLLIAGSVWFAADVVQSYRAVVSGTVPRLVPALPDGFAGHSMKADIFGLVITSFGSVYLLLLVMQMLRSLVAHVHHGKARIKIERDLSDSLSFNRLLDELREYSGFTQRIRLVITDSVAGPFATGLFRPAIVFPVALLTKLTMEEAETLIIHEFFHLMRRDQIMNVAITMLRIIFFFNPFALRLIDHILREREHACDDEVLRFGRDRLVYAEALYKVSRFTATPPTFVVAAGGHDKRLLLFRIRRLMNMQSKTLLPFRALLILVLFFAMAIFPFAPKTSAVAVNDGSRPAERNGNALPVRRQFNTVPVFADIADEIAVQDHSDQSFSAGLLEPVVITATKVSSSNALTAVYVTPENMPVPPVVAAPPPPPAPLPEDVAITEERPDRLAYRISLVARDVEEAVFSFHFPESLRGVKDDAFDPSQPFLQSSTFYSPDHEVRDISARKIIEL